MALVIAKFYPKGKYFVGKEIFLRFNPGRFASAERISGGALRISLFARGNFLFLRVFPRVGV
jgi:hypothetical protein